MQSAAINSNSEQNLHQSARGDSRGVAGEAFITLAKASKLAPGQPHSSAVWRWCRRGVLSRCGMRVRLKHVRMGGRVFTTREWLGQFGESLASADVRYFERRDAEARTAVPRDERFDPPRQKRRSHPAGGAAAADQGLEVVERELEEDGL